MFVKEKWEVEFHLVIMQQNSKRKKTFLILGIVLKITLSAGC